MNAWLLMLAALGFSVKAVKAKFVGPNPVFVSKDGEFVQDDDPGSGGLEA